MQRTLFYILLITLSFSFSALPEKTSELTKMKENSQELWNRKDILDGKVHVYPSFSQNGKRRVLTLHMAGIVKAPYDIVKEKVRNFSGYPEFFSFVKKVTDNREDHTVIVEATLLSHAFTSKANYTLSDDVISFKIVEGTLSGCSGFVYVHQNGDNQANIAIVSSIERKSFPVPDFLINWGAYYVIGKGAEYFRDKVEKKCREPEEGAVRVFN